MSRSLSASLTSSLLAQETSDALITLITLSHADIATPIRVCSDAVNVTSNGNVYTAFPFDLILPDDQEGSSPRAKLTIDNIDRSIIEAVREITSPMTVTIQIVRAAAPDTVEASFTGFSLFNVTYDAMTVQGDLGIEDFTAEPFPAGSFTPNNFPGLF